MTDRNMHSLRFNQAQRLLKAFKLIGSILLIIGVGSRKVTEHALNIDTGQGRCQLGKPAGITNLPPRPMMGISSEGMLISAVHHENGEERLHLLMVDPHIPAGAKLY